MEILWVKVGGLWPPDTGGRLRSFHILSELSRLHAVTVVTTHRPGEDPEALASALPRCTRVISIPHEAPKWHQPRFALHLLKSWLSRLPVDLMRHRVRGVREEVHRCLASGRFDVCIADFLVSLPNVPRKTPVPLVVFSHNVEHMIWKRLGRARSRLWERALLAVEWRKMRRYEGFACRRADLTLSVSDADRDALQRLSPGSTLHTVPTGVDVAHFAPAEVPERAFSLVYVGSMDWYPNEDAMHYFMEEILPRIRARVPETAVTVVGRNPSARLREAAAAANVHVTGTVDDVRPHVASAALFMVPLRVGGGTRLKIFEALAMAKAVVSTGIGAEGLPLVEEEHFVRADDPAGFAACAAALLRDPGRRKRLGQAGRRLVVERYAWQQVARDFGERCESLARAKGATPAGRSAAARVAAGSR